GFVAVMTKSFLSPGATIVTEAVVASSPFPAPGLIPAVTTLSFPKSALLIGPFPEFASPPSKSVVLTEMVVGTILTIWSVLDAASATSLITCSAVVSGLMTNVTVLVTGSQTTELVANKPKKVLKNAVLSNLMVTPLLASPTNFLPRLSVAVDRT